MDQIKENTDTFGFLEMNDISIKMIEKNKEVKNFKTSGQSFDTLQFSRNNSSLMGESIDGYLIQLNKRVDYRDKTTSFRDFL